MGLDAAGSGGVMAGGYQLADHITPKLVRRFQGRREVSPLYVADPRESDIETHACEEAERAGLRSVSVGDRTFVRFGSAWYSWALAWLLGADLPAGE